MKRVTFLLSMVVLLSFLAHAQDGRYTDFTSLAKKVEKSDAKVANPKKASKPKTWLKRADLMLDVFKGYSSNATIGMDESTFRLILGVMQPSSQEEVHGDLYAVYEFPRTDFFFKDGKLVFYRTKNELFPRPLDSALVALQRAHQVDEKGRYTDDIRKEVAEMRGYLLNDGVNAYTGANYEEALHAFEMVQWADKLPFVRNQDSSIYFYIGTAAYLAGQYEKAADNFLLAIRHGYTENGVLYCSYFDAVSAAGQSEKGRALLMEGVNRFPEQKCIVLNLINFLIQHKEDPKIVLPYLATAIEKDPQNEVLYFVQGVVYDQLKDITASENAYKEAIALKPDYVDAYYNISTLHYNQAVSLLQKASELPTSAEQEYDSLMEQSNAEFRSSIAPAEQALAIQPDYVPALELLKSVYFRFRSQPGMQDKYDAVMAKLRELGKEV